MFTLAHTFNCLRRLRAGEQGQTLVEYAMLAFCIAIASTIFLAAIGFDIAEVFDHLEDTFGLGTANNVTTGTGISDVSAATGTN
jgi:Flp pilus assembly pilin Flp